MQYAETYVASAFESGDDAVVEVTLDDYEMGQGGGSTRVRVRFRVRRAGETLFDEVIEGSGGATAWSSNKADFVSAARDSGECALQEAFESLVAAVLARSWSSERP